MKKISKIILLFGLSVLCVFNILSVDIHAEETEWEYFTADQFYPTWKYVNRPISMIGTVTQGSYCINRAYSNEPRVDGPYGTGWGTVSTYLYGVTSDNVQEILSTGASGTTTYIITADDVAKYEYFFFTYTGTIYDTAAHGYTGKYPSHDSYYCAQVNGTYSATCRTEAVYNPVFMGVSGNGGLTGRLRC